MKRCEDAAPLLGAFLDSALAGDDRDWVEEHLRECAACRERQAFIAAQGAALRERLEARGAQADFTGFADRVLARALQEKELRGSEHLRVWGSEMWGAHRRAIVGAGGIFAAACLALAVVFTPPAAETIDEPLLADASIPQLETVDFGSHDGAVTELRDRTPVIWLSEDRQ
jgi:anti-sigma factor RsiW